MHDTFVRPYSSYAGLLTTLPVAIDFFDLLGVDDDKGKGTDLDLSPRSLWNLCIRAHSNYGGADPELIGRATEGVILGVISGFF